MPQQETELARCLNLFVYRAVAMHFTTFLCPTRALLNQLMFYVDQEGDHSFS